MRPLTVVRAVAVAAVVVQAVVAVVNRTVFGDSVPARHDYWKTARR